jgi:hypothetical protein
MKFSPTYKSPLSMFRTLSSLHHWHALRTHFLAQMNWQQSRREGKSLDLDGPTPWWSYSCTDFLDQVVPTTSSVLEIGGGASTAWWASRGNSVTTLETDPHWASVQRKANQQYASHTEVQEIPDLNPSTLIPLLAGRTFDVVVNDGSGNRSDLAVVLSSVLVADGILIWDNSDRLEYAQGIEDLVSVGFKPLHFFGLSPISAYASKTTIFSKHGYELKGRPVQFPEVNY